MARNEVFEHYNSLEWLERTLRERKVNNAAMEGEHLSTDTSERKCRTSGTSSYEEAVDLMLHGWDEKLKEVKQKFNAAARENASVEVGKVRPSTGVVGYAPCVPNAIRGLPNSMIMSERVPHKVKCVSIVYTAGVDCSWEPEEIVNSGIAVLKLVNNLENKGYRVKLVQEVVGSREDRDTATLFVDLKDFRQPLDLKKLCFPMMHSSMLRRIAFKWLETVPNLENRGFRGGYGSPLSKQFDERVKALREGKCIGENDYYITAYVCRECNYDIERIMDRVDMKIK